MPADGKFGRPTGDSRRGRCRHRLGAKTAAQIVHDRDCRPECHLSARDRVRHIFKLRFDVLGFPFRSRSRLRILCPTDAESDA